MSTTQVEAGMSGLKPELKKRVLGALSEILSTSAFSELPRGKHPLVTLTTANSSGFRPLHYVAASNIVSLQQTLLELFSCLPLSQFRLVLDCRDKEGNTALHWSIVKGSVDTFSMLVQAGSGLNLANFDGRTPLHMAVEVAENLSVDTANKMVTLLLRHGANPNVGDQSGITPLHVASELGIVPLIEALVEEGGANVNAVDEEGENALFYALRGQHEGAVRKLVEYGIDVSAGNSDGESASDFCNSVGDTEMAEFLLSLQNERPEDTIVLNPRSLSMELSESGALSASSGIWFSGREVRSSF